MQLENYKIDKNNTNIYIFIIRYTYFSNNEYIKQSGYIC